MALKPELLNPIAGDNPSGANIRYDPVFDKIREARKPKEDMLTESVDADYKSVVKLGEEVLIKKSKDLQIAVWLTEAYLRLRGLAGLHDGLTLIKGLLENFWDTLYPELEDGDTGLRLAPLDWLGSYLEVPIKLSPLTKGGYNLFQYRESQIVGFAPREDDFDEGAEQRRNAYATAVSEGKVTSELFTSDFDKTPKQFYVDTLTQVDEMLELLETFNAYCEEKFRDEPPSFSKMRTALEETRMGVNSLLQEKRKTEPDPGDESGEESEPDGESSSEEAPQEYGGSDGGTVRVVKKRKKNLSGIEPGDIDEIGDRLDAIASFLRAQDMGNPASYLMLRGYRWGELRASGNSAPDATLLDPPNTEARIKIKKLSLDGSWEELVNAGEEIMAGPGGRAWLDLQRYIVTALENMSHYAAATAVKSAIKSLLQDLPDMLQMTMMDDSPVANSETQSWIREQILPPPPEPEPEPVQEESYRYEPEPEPEPEIEAEPPPMGDDTPTEPGVPDAFQLAMDAVREGNKEQAVEILMREMLQERSGRAKFRRRMQLAQVCISIGRQPIAKPILEELASEIEKRKLDEWENADVVAHTLALLYRCLDGDNERKQQLYGWICRLDPVQAMSCGK